MSKKQKSTKASSNTSSLESDVKAGLVFGLVAFIINTLFAPDVAGLMLSINDVHLRSFAAWQYAVSMLLCALAAIPVLYFFKLKQFLAKGVLASTLITAGIYCIFWRTIYIENDNLAPFAVLSVMVVLGALGVVGTGKILQRFKHPEYPLTIALVTLAFLFLTLPWAAVRVNFYFQVRGLVSSITYDVYIPPSDSGWTKVSHLGSDDDYKQVAFVEPVDTPGLGNLPDYNRITSMQRQGTDLHNDDKEKCGVPHRVWVYEASTYEAKCTLYKQSGSKKIYVEYIARPDAKYTSFLPENIFVQQGETVYHISVYRDFESTLKLAEQLVPATRRQLIDMLNTGVELYPVSYDNVLDIPCSLQSNGGLANCF